MKFCGDFKPTNIILSLFKIMKKIKFKKVDVDFRVVKSTNDKYLLLSLFIGQYRFPDNIQEIIDMLKSVKNGSKT